MSKFVVYTQEGERVFGFKACFDTEAEAFEAAAQHAGDRVIEYPDDVGEFPKWFDDWD